jgi:hypothetical protein
MIWNRVRPNNVVSHKNIAFFFAKELEQYDTYGIYSYTYSLKICRAYKINKGRSTFFDKDIRYIVLDTKLKVLDRDLKIFSYTQLRKC